MNTHRTPQGMDSLKIYNPIQGFCLFFILLGILLRVDYFMENRSLRGDEAAYFSCLVSRTPQDILLGRNYNFYSPPAPIGFSFIERLCMNFFGYSEHVLRLIPLIFSLCGGLLFYSLVSQYSLSWAVPLAMGLFATSDRLIFFSADMHPYSAEVFFAILVLWMFNRLENKGFRSRDRMYFIFATVISVWFSYTVVFVLGGIAITSLGLAIFQKQKKLFRKILITHSFWAISFLFVYGVTIYPIMQRAITYSMWEGYFIKEPLNVLSAINWGLKAFWGFFRDPLGIISPLLGILLFFAGIRQLFYTNKRQIFLILSPFILTLGAALFKEYPFAGRTVLFLTPCFLILISLGVEIIVNHSKGRMRMFWLSSAFVILFIYPLMKTLDHFVYGWDNEEAREATRYLKDHMLPGDTLLMNNSARFSYGYYMGYFHIDMKNRWIGRIWDSLFEEHSNRPNARCIFEQLVSDSNGFFIATISNKDRLSHRIYSDQWLDVGYKREWLLLIEPSESLIKFLKRSLDHEQRLVKEIRFKNTYLYLLEKW